MRTRQKRVATDTWRSLGCRTTPLEHWSRRKPTVEPPPLQPQPVDDVFGRWQVDILSGVPTTKDKYKHILVLVDSYSKWVELFPLRTQEASEVAAVLFTEIISRYGAPRSILSDRVSLSWLSL